MGADLIGSCIYSRIQVPRPYIHTYIQNICTYVRTYSTYVHTVCIVCSVN